MKRIDGLRDIADQFDLYLVDQYGVLHDGVAAYPGAIEGLARIASGGRDIIVLTNSGKDASDNLARLSRLGFSGSHFRVVSSGEVGLQLVRSGGLGPAFTVGLPACVIGRGGDRYAFSSDEFELVTRPADAAFLVFAGSDAPRTSLESYRAQLQAAAQAGVPAICVAARYATADKAKPAPDPMPNIADRDVSPATSDANGRSRSAGASSRTPSVPLATASADATVSRSPSSTKEKSATWTTSVFEYATPTAKLRSRIVRRSNAVAAICASPPNRHHAKNANDGIVNRSPVARATSASHKAANGSP